MDTEIYRDYEFGIGGIDEVLNWLVDRVDCFEDITIPRQGNIIIPKIIGIYQNESRFTNNPTRKFQFDDLDNQTIFSKTGLFERIDPNLICIAYDPTNISYNILKDAVKGDLLGRLKITDYTNLPDFYEKNVPEPTQSLKKINKENESVQEIVIDRDKNVLEIAKEDFGLTRYEAVELLCANHFLNRPAQSDIIITRPGNMIVLPRTGSF